MSKVVGKLKIELLTDIEEVKEMFEKLADQNKELRSALKGLTDLLTHPSLDADESVPELKKALEVLEDVDANS